MEQKTELTEKQKEQLGQAMLFVGALGTFFISDELEIKAADLATYLISADADIASWWNTRNHRQQMHILQHIKSDPTFLNRFEPSWSAMSIQAQTLFHSKLQDLCARAVDRLYSAGTKEAGDAVTAMREASAAEALRRVAA